MQINYEQATQLFDKNAINKLLQAEGGLRFLKLRSMSRQPYLKDLLKANNIAFDDKQELLQLAFESDISETRIEDYIKSNYAIQRAKRITKEPQLINELYRLQTFDWGGLYQNNLEPGIVNQYVKKIPSYSQLERCIEGDILRILHGYIKCIWYNHWTSLIIKGIFKDHPKVIPAIRFVKNIDFFYRDQPWNLKVSYLPDAYVLQHRIAAGFENELKSLKLCATALNMSVPVEKNPAKRLELLWLKLADHPSDIAINCIRELSSYREQIIQESMDKPQQLLRWFYENQARSSFDASNRIYLILINKADYFNSWKLKRAKPLLLESINHFLDENDKLYQVDFNWNNTSYKAYSGVIFIIQNKS